MVNKTEFSLIKSTKASSSTKNISSNFKIVKGNNFNKRNSEIIENKNEDKPKNRLSLLGHRLTINPLNSPDRVHIPR